MEHEPQTIEGIQVWSLMNRLNGQLRLAGMGGVVGVDLTAALALADILGVDKKAVAELMPAIEAGVVEALSKANNDGAEDAGSDVIEV